MTMLRFSGGSRTSGYTVLQPDRYESDHVEEGETLSCVHCQYIWQIKPGSGLKRGFCFNCNGPVCGKKECMEKCIPFEKALEMMEGKEQFWKSFRQVNKR